MIVEVKKKREMEGEKVVEDKKMVTCIEMRRRTKVR